MIDDFLSEKLVEISPELLKRGFVAGTSIAALLAREQPKDIDFFFFTDGEEFTEVLLDDYHYAEGPAVLRKARKKKCSRCILPRMPLHIATVFRLY
jgi:hypothetical protein